MSDDKDLFAPSAGGRPAPIKLVGSSRGVAPRIQAGNGCVDLWRYRDPVLLQCSVAGAKWASR